MLKLSLIIPVYDEEHHIKDCLDAVANQTIMPYEVIVVDNNCTDRTIDIANRYEFVKVVTELRQGRAYARTAGFNAASGDIVGRIDSDSKLKPDWTEKVISNFENDSQLMGLTGLAFTPVIPFLRNPKSKIISRTYYWFAHAVFGTITTWGATMAVRKTAWDRVKDRVCLSDKIVHEDQDIALWMTGLNMKIAQKNDVLVVSTNQSFRYLPKLIHYSGLMRSTIKFHRKAGNLPAPKELRLKFFKRAISVILAVPVTLYGYVGSLVFFPIDFLGYKVLDKQKWFD